MGHCLGFATVIGVDFCDAGAGGTGFLAAGFCAKAAAVRNATVSNIRDGVRKFILTSLTGTSAKARSLCALVRRAKARRFHRSAVHSTVRRFHRTAFPPYGAF